MKTELIERLICLKENPDKESIDHLSELHALSEAYDSGLWELQPIMTHFLDGWDDLPTLKEKGLWKEDRFKDIRKPFTQKHNELVETIDKLVEQKLSKAAFLDYYSKGQRQFSEIDLEDLDLRDTQLEGVIFEKCALPVDFRNCNLPSSRFIQSNLKTSDFRKTNLKNSHMTQVSFEGCKFKGAQVEGIVFEDNFCYSTSGIGQQDFDKWLINQA